MKFWILLWSKSQITACFVVFLHTALYKKETKQRDKIVREVRTASCKPSVSGLLLPRWRVTEELCGALRLVRNRTRTVRRMYTQDNYVPTRWRPPEKGWRSLSVQTIGLTMLTFYRYKALLLRVLVGVLSNYINIAKNPGNRRFPLLALIITHRRG